MSIFIKVGYVTNRTSARLHLNVDGRARCGAGSGRITISATLTGDSAPSICRRCANHLREKMIWRSDDLYRLHNRAIANREECEINRLFDALDDLMSSPEAKAKSASTKIALAATFDRMEKDAQPKPLLTAPPIEDSQVSLF